jgi:HNH endonuclease
MAFSESTKDEIFKNSLGLCECTRRHVGQHVPHHGDRCPNIITRKGKWDAHHITAVSSGGKDTVFNGEALCIPCHELTQSYGRS